MNAMRDPSRPPSRRLRQRAVAARAVALLTAAAACASAEIHAQTPAAGHPGPEHRALAELAGEWQVRLDGEPVGRASVRTRLDGRYVEFDLRGELGPMSHVVYTLGFDARHGEYIILAMDDAGTYWVTARGAMNEGVVKAYGTDDDPQFEAMGLQKEFAIWFERQAADHVTFETRFIDTRTPDRKEIPFLAFELRRIREKDGAAPNADEDPIR